MNRTLLAAIALLTVSALIGCGGGEAPAKSYTFAFNLPDSVSFSVEFSKMRLTRMGENAMTDSSWTLTRQQIVADEGQFMSTRQTDSMVQYRDGVRFDDPVLAIFASYPITYVIDSSGMAVEVLGYEELFASLDSVLGADTAAMVRQVITPEALKAQEMGTWNERLTPFVGIEYTVGLPKIDTTYTELPIEGRLELFHLTELLDTVVIDGHVCGEVRMVSGTDPARIAELTGRTTEEVGQLLGMTEEQLDMASNRRAGTSSIRNWVLEFQTMLSHSEDSRFFVHYDELAETGVTVRSEIQETQQKRFTYPSP